MSDLDLPELPSDEELGIDGMDLDELQKLLEDEAAAREGRPPPAAPPPSPPRPGTDEAPAPARGGWGAGLLALGVLLAGAWASSGERVLPDPVPANVPDTVFSSGRAMAGLVEMARAPRPIGSYEHARVREMILERLDELGAEPRVHTTTTVRRAGPGARSATIRNLVARVPGTDPTGAVLLTAHYDAVPLSAGAGDDATGVWAILETIRALRASAPFRNDVIVLITDGEESGLLGARAFVEEHPWMDDVSVVVSVEMRGGGGPVHMFETGAENGRVVRAMRASDPRPFATSTSVEIYRRLPNDTDFTPFREAGVQGLNYAAIGRAWMYHQATDVPVNLQEESLQHHGMRLLALTRELGTADLSDVRAPDLVFTTLPLFGIVAYPEGWSLPISGGVLLLWIGALGLVVARGGRWLGALAGLGITVVIGGAGWALGWGLMRWLPAFHPEFGSMTPAFYGEEWYGLALAAATTTVALLVLGFARRRFSVAALGAGAAFVPVAGAVALSLAAPLTALELQIPALAAVLAVGIAGVGAGVRPEGRPGGAAGVGILLLALPVLAVTVPFVEGFQVAMSFRAAALVGVLVAVVLACLVPALDRLASPNRLWAPTAALLAAAGFIGIGLLGSRPSPERPHPSTLLYVLDRERGEAAWLTRDDPGFAWAENNVGPFTGEGDLSRFLEPGEYRSVWAPIHEVPEPEVRLLGPTPAGPPGAVRLALRSRAGAEWISLVVREDEGSVVRVEDREVPFGEPGSAGARRPATRVTHLGVPLGEEGALVLDVQVELGVDALHLAVVEQHLRPWELVGPEPFARPPTLMPSTVGRSDRAFIRTPVTLGLLDLGAAGEPPAAASASGPGPDPGGA